FQVAPSGDEPVAEAATAGVKLLARERVLALLFGSWVLACLAGGVVNVGEILLAKATFGAGTAGFGLLASCCGAGLVLGSVLSPRLLDGRDSTLLYPAGLATAALGC